MVVWTEMIQEAFVHLRAKITKRVVNAVNVTNDSSFIHSLIYCSCLWCHFNTCAFVRSFFFKKKACLLTRQQRKWDGEGGGGMTLELPWLKYLLGRPHSRPPLSRSVSHDIQEHGNMCLSTTFPLLWNSVISLISSSNPTHKVLNVMFRGLFSFKEKKSSILK